MGYPGIDLDERGGEVEGFLFSSEDLSDHWVALDAFEGEAYEQVLADVRLKDGRAINAFVYALRGGEVAPGSPPGLGLKPDT
jgi:hypothetical protein